MHREQADQIADNQTVRNIIISMRAISAFEWPQFVEDVSLVDECLRAHDGYGAMDFLTRDRYRHAIEDLARRSPYSEVEIARRVIDKVQRVSEHSTTDGRQQEPGYYLIGAGRYAFEQEVDFQPSFKQQLLRVYINHAGFAYVGSIGLLTLLLLALPLSASITAGLSGFQLFLLALFGLFPASDIAVGLVNRLIIFGPSAASPATARTEGRCAADAEHVRRRTDDVHQRGRGKGADRADGDPLSVADEDPDRLIQATRCALPCCPIGQTQTRKRCRTMTGC